jgi:uncharacterized delta-60 repeat protein
MRKPKLWTLSSLTILLILSGLALPAKSQEEPSILWAKTFDGGSSDEARGVTVDSLDNIIVTGWSIQETPQNYMTVKYDGNGNEIWNRTYGDGRQARSVAVDSLDNIVVTGFQFNGFTDSFLTVKYDQNGNMLWDKTYGEDMQGEGVAVDSQNNVIAVGYYYVEDMMQQWDIIIVKYNSNGNQIWSTTYDDLEGEHAFDVAIDSNDNILITGASYDGMTNNLIAIKYNKDGNLLWARTYNGGYEDEGHGVAVDSLDNVIVTGFTSDTTNRYFLTIKYDEDGTKIWTKTHRKELQDEAYSVAVDSKDNILVTGWSFDGTTRDLTTIEYDKDGNQLWTTSYEGSPTYGSFVELRGYGIAVDSMDDIIVTGAIYYIIPQKLSDFFTIKLLLPRTPKVETHDIAADETIFHVTTESNSTISDLHFIKEDKKLQFNVTGPTNTNGFCNTTIPNQLLGGPFNILIDGQLLSEILTSDNGTHTWLYFTYPHSVHTIEIIGTTAIPESPPTILLSLFAFVTLIGVALAKKKIQRKEMRTHESRF